MWPGAEAADVMRKMLADAIVLWTCEEYGEPYYGLYPVERSATAYGDHGAKGKLWARGTSWGDRRRALLDWLVRYADQRVQEGRP